MNSLLFVNNIQGSDKCWSKLIKAGDFYGVEAVLVGGDFSGIGLQLMIKEGNNRWRTECMGRTMVVHEDGELKELEAGIRAHGLYPIRVEPDEAEELAASVACQADIFESHVVRTMEQWIEQAEKSLKETKSKYVMVPGSNDPLAVDEILDQSKIFTLGRNERISLGGKHVLVTESFGPPSLANTYRVLSEEELLAGLEQKVAFLEDLFHALFYIHTPPFGSGLDNIPSRIKHGALKEKSFFASSGSRSVRRVIESCQPLLSLHGQIPESFGHVRIGRTLCLNPQNLSREGVLSGYLVNLGEEGVRSFQPVRG